MAITQKHRFVKINTSLDDDVLLLRRMSGSERLSTLFEYNLELYSYDMDIKHEDVLGQKLTLSLELGDGGERCFDGYVTSFDQTGYEEDFVLYQAVVRPWFWFLTRTADCRIFQSKTVETIIKEVCNELGFTDISFELESSYREWKYCVQYRETDYNFLSRLMEQEGMYYYFSHENGKHTLVIVDSSSYHRPITDYETIPYFPPGGGVIRDQEYIQDWHISKQVQSGSYVLNDFDFQIPKKSLLQISTVPREHENSGYEIYDFPGEYWEAEPEGQNYVKARIEELQAQYEVLFGSGNARGITSGAQFELSQYPREDQNRSYLLISCAYEITTDSMRSGNDDNEEKFNVSFSCIDSNQQYRAPRVTSKPCIMGLQSAIIVGGAGEEIHTDKWGRVKVQFHWDRYGKTDDKSSCWIRVAQVWAGKGWGAIFTPRIGQEVLVSFVEGDPDRPIIVGRVYNNDNMPPYALPENATQSGFLTRSSKGGNASNANEFRFEDKKGSEEVYLHAEKDQNISVENCETHSVGVDRTKTIGHDETKSIGNDETKQVAKNRSVTIGSNKTETVAINKAETIGVSKELTIGAAYQVTVGAVMNETVGASKSQEVAASKSTLVGGNVTETYGKNQKAAVSKNLSETVGENKTVKIGKDLLIDVGDSIVIKTGKASITMKKDGTIQIVGKDILVKGSGEIDVKATKNITMKGKKILQN